MASGEQQDLDRNEVYREDYEEGVPQNQGIKIDYNSSYIDSCADDSYDDSYNQSYQTPYYNYHEDYFNEEDEYKYLEKEREEAANLEMQQKQEQQHQHHQQHQRLDQHDHGLALDEVREPFMHTNIFYMHKENRVAFVLTQHFIMDSTYM